MDVRTYRPADCNLDHYLVDMRYKSRIMRGRKNNGPRMKRLHLEKLKTSETSIDYQNKIDEALKSCNREVCNSSGLTGCAMEKIWRIKRAIASAGEEVLGPRPGR